MSVNPLCRLSAFDGEKEEWQVMIETPKGCHNKYKYDEDRNVFVLNGVLPEGMVFPYDFGFLPATLGEDGDPLDVLLLMDEPAFCGCLVPSRLIGVIEAEQTEIDGETRPTDCLVAVPLVARNVADIKTVKDLNEHLLNEVAQFFVSYNRIHERNFKILGLHGPPRAEKLCRKGSPGSRSRTRVTTTARRQKREQQRKAENTMQWMFRVFRPLPSRLLESLAVQLVLQSLRIVLKYDRGNVPALEERLKAMREEQRLAIRSLTRLPDEATHAIRATKNEIADLDLRIREVEAQTVD